MGSMRQDVCTALRGPPAHYFRAAVLSQKTRQTPTGSRVLSKHHHSPARQPPKCRKVSPRSRCVTLAKLSPCLSDFHQLLGASVHCRPSLPPTAGLPLSCSLARQHSWQALRRQTAQSRTQMHHSRWAHRPSGVHSCLHCIVILADSTAAMGQEAAASQPVKPTRKRATKKAGKLVKGQQRLFAPRPAAAAKPVVPSDQVPEIATLVTVSI